MRNIIWVFLFVSAVLFPFVNVTQGQEKTKLDLVLECMSTANQTICEQARNYDNRSVAIAATIDVYNVTATIITENGWVPIYITEDMYVIPYKTILDTIPDTRTLSTVNGADCDEYSYLVQAQVRTRIPSAAFGIAQGTNPSGEPHQWNIYFDENKQLWNYDANRGISRFNGSGYRITMVII